MSDDEIKDEPDILLLRQKNLEEKAAFLAAVTDDPEYISAVNYLNELSRQRNTQSSQKTVHRKSRSQKDTVFRFTGQIPQGRRSSARLQNKNPDFSYKDLPDEKQLGLSRDRDGDPIYEDLEEIVYEVKKQRKSYGRRPSPPRLPVEDVTQAMIDNIHLKGNKIYGRPDATSCHQCRQKTSDQKTICRSGFCVGIRGQFCGICVVQRYGEDPAEALKDPNWHCYVCRGCCNCSFCRAKAGKRPTGILVPIAKNNGFNSVHEFLMNLNGFGDKNNDSGLTDDSDLLGFDGSYAICSGGERISLTCYYDEKILMNLKKDDDIGDANRDVKDNKAGAKRKSSFNFKIRLRNKRPENDTSNLLGFDGIYAVMGGNKKIKLDCLYDKLDP